jgi:F-type H+-transporting ATPase subunit delta
MAKVHESESRAGEEGSSERRLARVYAEALLDVAQERGQADEIVQDLQVFVTEVYEEAAELEETLSSPVIKRVAKVPILEKLFKGRVNDLFYNFLIVLNAKDRLGLIRHVLAAYRDLLDQRAKRIRVTVRSVVPLSDQQVERLTQAIAQATGLDPMVSVKTDAELLGGMIVQVGDHVFDSSVRNRIETIRNQLLARSSYEIQAGRNRFSYTG